MKRDILGFLHVRRLRQSPAFTFLIAALLCGVFAGGLTGMYIPQANGSYVQELAKLVASNAAGRMPSVRTVCAGAAGTFGWIAAAGVLGAVPGRALWIALLTAVRGFLLSFAAAAALAQSGLWGIYIAFVSIGVSAVFWLPAMLLVGHSGIGNRGAAEQVFPRMETIWRIVPAVRAAVAAVAGMAASGGSGSAGAVLNRKAVYAMNWHMQLLY